MRIVAGVLMLVALGLGCSDEPPKPDLSSDGSAADTSPDAPQPDLSPDGPPPLPCSIHHDCPQGSYCYYKGCVTDPDYPVYHCNKKDSSDNDTCPPGHKCVDKAGKTSICAESSTYACNDACDCGPAHCCKDVSGTKRCVKDTADPWLPGGTATGGATCVQGTDATYCAAAPACHTARQAFNNAGMLSSFRAYNRKRQAVSSQCGGSRCFGSAINCDPGESCIDTQQAAPLPGKACLLLAGGTCVSNALAEAIFGYKPSDLLPRCTPTCPKGKPCDAGWVSDRKWAYKRIVGTCGSCGNGTCDPGEWHNNCPKDCSCGDGICASSEATTCFQDCAKCGNKVCEPGEMSLLGGNGSVHLPALGTCTDCFCGSGTCDRSEVTSTSWSFSVCVADCTCGDGVCAQDEVCPKDCVCLDSNAYVDKGRICGDGVCAGDQRGCEDLETCLSCPADCGACAWSLEQRSSGSALPPVRFANAAWGDLGTGIFVVGRTDQTLGMVLRYDGQWSSYPLPLATELESLWGSSANNIFAASMTSGLYRFNGKAWQPMVGPSGAANLYNCDDVWGRSATEVYALCNDLLLRYDGNALNKWEVVATPTVKLQGSSSYGRQLWGPPAPSDELYLALGTGIDRCTISSKACKPMVLPAGATPKALWGTQNGSKVEIFAVGSKMWRYDGNATWSWTAVPLPASTFPYAIWGRSVNEVYAMTDQDGVWRFDGKTWSKMSVPSTHSLKAIWGNATDIFTLCQSGTILRYDDKQQQWTVLATPANLIGAPRELLIAGVWAASPTDVFSIWGSAVIRYDGTSFSTMSLPNSAPLYGISGQSGTDLLAVGGKPHFASLPVVLRYDGATWSKQSAPMGGALVGVQAVNKSYYAVGDHKGKIWRYDGKAWEVAATLGGPEWLAGVAKCSATKLAVVGGTGFLGSFGPGSFDDKGFVSLFDTVTKGWTPAIVSGVTNLLGVWCDASDNVVAVGDLIEKGVSGAGLHEFAVKVTPKIVSCTNTNGLICKVITPPVRARYTSSGGLETKTGLHAVWGTSKSDLYAAGVGGDLLHFNGAQWEPLAADIRGAGHNWGCTDLLGIWGTKSDLFISTRSGVLRLGKLP